MGGDNFKPNIYSKGLWNQLQPGFSNIINQFNTQSGMPGYGIPQAPQMPSMVGTLTGAPTYNIPGFSGYSLPTYGISGYDVPSTSSIMPTQDWWNNLSSEVKSGAWAPFEEGKRNMLETLGGSGISGSARGGYSGAAGAALGQYMADASPAYAMNLWNMTSPGAMAGWQAQLGANQYMAGQQNQLSQWNAANQLGLNQYMSGLQNQQAMLELERNKLGYQNTLTERTQDYNNTMNQMQQNYAGQMQAWQMPWNMMMNYNNLAPSGAYHDGGGGGVMGAIGSIASPFLGMAGYGAGGALGGIIGTGMGNLFRGWGTPPGMVAAQTPMMPWANPYGGSW